MRIHTSVLLTLFVSACAITNSENENLPLREILAGDWGSSLENCEAAPYTIYFSDDDKNMFILLRKSPDNKDDSVPVTKTVVYNITSQSNNEFRVDIEGETRLTEDGKTVVWDLRLVSENRFCWRRTDWAKTTCTAFRRRCN